MDPDRLRHPGITDCARVREGGAHVRLTGFYRIEEIPALPLLGGGSTVRVLRPCRPEDPGLEVIGSSASCGLFHRPWEITWEGPIPWSAELVEDHREMWRRTVADRDLSDMPKSSSYPQLFARFPPMSRHERMAVLSWRRQTDALIRACEGVRDRADNIATS